MQTPAKVRPTGDILVVDDNRPNLVAIEAALGELSGRVVRAQSGQEALRLVLNQDFTVILLDVQMPGMGGIETARLIRSRDRSAHTPIIFVTGYQQDDQQILAAYQLGAVDFLSKPIVAEVLRAKVSVFVELDKRNKALARQAEQLREHERREHARELEEERRRWDAQAMQERMIALAEIDRRKDEFLAMLSHELRNPLASVVLGLELMRRRLEDLSPDEGLHGTRDRIEQQVKHLARIVDDLLDLARINSGKIELRREPLSLQEVVESAVAVSRPTIEQRKHQLVVELPPEPVKLLADPVRLTQVLSNLLNNAACYTSDGGLLRVRARQIGQEVEIAVADNGRGIRPEILPRIFDMFVQGDPSTGAGIGLGLTVVKRLVELHGGSVQAHSAGLGQGTEFVLRLPAPPLTGSVEVSPPSSATTTKPLRIALVEDSPDIREMTQELLTMLGHEVQAAEDGEKGVELILRLRPDVALVDMGLPGLDGCAVASRVRAECGSEVVRLVAMTGFGLDSDRRRAREAGFDDYLVKPADIDALVRALTTRS
jgi:signal transduction histidine kinase